MNREFAIWCFDEGVRVEKILLLSSIGDDSSNLNSDFDDFGNDIEEAELDRLFGDGAWARSLALSGEREPAKYPNAEGLNELVMEREKYGLLAQVTRDECRPVDATSRQTTGFRNLTWLYAEDLVSLVAAIRTWAAEREAAEYEKAGIVQAL